MNGSKMEPDAVKERKNKTSPLFPYTCAIHGDDRGDEESSKAPVIFQVPVFVQVSFPILTGSSYCEAI